MPICTWNWGCMQLQIILCDQAATFARSEVSFLQPPHTLLPRCDKREVGNKWRFVLVYLDSRVWFYVLKYIEIQGVFYEIFNLIAVPYECIGCMHVQRRLRTLLIFACSVHAEMKVYDGTCMHVQTPKWFVRATLIPGHPAMKMMRIRLVYGRTKWTGLRYMEAI